MSGFNERIREYGAWRTELAASIGRYGQWLADAGLSDPQLQARLGRVLDRLRDDRMSVAFVAEFSRGKSELINALFFADFGQRVLPSSAGRTTMCPTELLWDPSLPPGIRLLPIETRLRDVTVADLRHVPDEWRTVPIDPKNVESLKLAFECVRETKRVPVEDAILMGLFDETDEDSPLAPDDDDMIEVSCWRHALVNIPHPLLETGLVVIDTPGLNAIGAEPELTLNLIPSAHAVLFVLAADAGVTRTDIEVWRERISPAHRSGRFVVLNKID
nr:dynamin family protein [Burkholderiaceae bacterium]